MSIKYAERVKEVASNKPNAATAFNLPNSAPSGFQPFDSAYATNDQCPCLATNGTDWESGLYTFTAGSPDTLTRSVIFESSNAGSAVDFSAGGDVTVFVEWPASHAGLVLNSLQSVVPGGRLTLQSGVPVPTTDQTGKTSVYYTPYLHNIINLWDGYAWSPVTFTEATLALGTVTASLPYDVFAYVSAGALALEKVAWTSSTTRASAISLQDGRYCKTSDKTRLYLGSFYTTSTTTTEDSEGGTTTNVGGKRFLWNMYNRVVRAAKVIDTTDNWSYATSSFRQANGNSGNKVEVLKGIVEDIDKANVYAVAYLVSNGFPCIVGPGINSTSAITGFSQGGLNANAGGVYAPVSAAWSGNLSLGYNYVSWNEKGTNGTCIFLGDNGGDGQQAGMSAEVWA